MKGKKAAGCQGQFSFDGIYSNSLSSRTFTCGCLHDGGFVVVTYVVLGPLRLICIIRSFTCASSVAFCVGLLAST